MGQSNPIKQGCFSAVMLRVSGPDPKGRKMRQHAFFHSKNGITTLSASGICLPVTHTTDLQSMSSTQVLVLTDASLVEPFIRQSHSPSIPSVSTELPSPFGPSSSGVRSRAIPIKGPVERMGNQELGGGGKETLPGTKIMVLFDEESGVEGWHEGELLDMVEIRSASEALSSLLSAHASIDSGGWQLGWHLVSVDKGPQSQGAVSHKIRSTTTFAVPGSPQPHETEPSVANPGCLESCGVPNPGIRNGSLSGDRAYRAYSSGYEADALRQEPDGIDGGETFGGVAFEPRDLGNEGGPFQRRVRFAAEADRVRLAVLRVTVSSARGSAHRGVLQGGPTISGDFSPEAPLESRQSSRADIESKARRFDSDGSVQYPNPRASFLDLPSSSAGHHQAALVSAGPLSRGDSLTAVGSPFGALSPRHFSNSVTLGVVSNWWPGGSRAPILLADMRCLPGMEGGPVLDKSGGVVGMLWRPIRQRKSGAEVQLVITADALAPALRPFGIDLLPRTPSICHVASSGASTYRPVASSGPHETAATRANCLLHPAMVADVEPRGKSPDAQSCSSTESLSETGSLNDSSCTTDSSRNPVSDGQDTLYLQPTATTSAPFLRPTRQSAPSKPRKPAKSAGSRRSESSVNQLTDIFDRPFEPPATAPSAVHERPSTQPLLAGCHTPSEVSTAEYPGAIHTPNDVTAAVQSAAASVVMVLVDDGAWGSGVVLSASGLILTNAHLIEPWRFAAKPKVQPSKPQPLARTPTNGVQALGAFLRGGNEHGGRFAAPEQGVAQSGEPCGSEGGLKNFEGSTRDIGNAAETAERFPGERSGKNAGFLADSVAKPGMLWEGSHPESGGESQKAVDRRSNVGYWDWINGGVVTCSGQDAPRGHFRTRQADGMGCRSGAFPKDRSLEEQASSSTRAGLQPDSASFTETLLGPAQASGSDSGHHTLCGHHKLCASESLIPCRTASNPPRRYRPVRVRLSDREGATWQSARVVFVAQGPFDAAVLQLLDAPTGLQPVIPTTQDAAPGETALVIGHGLFGPMTDLRPSVYSGVVSRVVKSRGRPAMLQTTAAVHPGGSGGAVVDARGRLIGLVTSAARHSGGSMLPHLNFSIPAKALQPVFDFAASGGSKPGLLDPLNTADSNLSAVWALAPPPTLPRPPSLLPGQVPNSLPGQEDASLGSAKGTKFAEFLADRGQGLMKKALLRSKL